MKPIATAQRIGTQGKHYSPNIKPKGFQYDHIPTIRYHLFVARFNRNREEMILLSILIPTLPERKHLLQRVCEHLGAFNPEEVEIVIDNRGREITTGQKRNELVAKANGLYVVHLDDDDWPQGGYINDILQAIKDNNYPDCISFEGWMTTDGKSHVDWVIKLGEKYEARQDSDGVTRYYRFPNHIVPIKKSIAIQFKFPDKTQGEDFAWADGIRKLGLIKTSYHINKKLYHYDFKTRK